MLVQYGCYKCILNQCVELAFNAAPDDENRRRILVELLGHVGKESKDSTPPEMAALFYQIFARETGITDPYAEAKRKSTELAKQLYKEFAEQVANSSDRFQEALRLSIGGNVIDYGANPDFQLDSAAGKIRETAGMFLDMQALEQLRCDIQKAEKILYILDNCGEAVLDRLLINEIGEEKITLGVRGGAILNDITHAELKESALDDLPVVDTGYAAPGVSLKHSSEKFLETMKSSDLIITKGQGNFESLYGAFDDVPVYFLFRVKCPVIASQTKAELNSLQIVKNPQKNS